MFLVNKNKLSNLNVMSNYTGRFIGLDILFRLLRFICFDVLKWALQNAVFLCPSGVKLCITCLCFLLYRTGREKECLQKRKEEKRSVLGLTAMNRRPEQNLYKITFI